MEAVWEEMPGVLESVWAEEAGGGAGEAGAGGGDETQGEEGADGGETADEGDGTQDGAAGEGEEGADGKKPDGRNNPDAIRKHLAQLKTDPQTAPLAKAINDKLGKARGYEEVFPTVKEAREFKQLLDSAGGRDEITSAIESRAKMQQVDAMLEGGDPAVLKEIFDQAPEGMAKLAGPILDELAQRDPKAYHAALVPHAVQFMASQGLAGAMNALIDSYKSDDKAGMEKTLASIVQWWKGLTQGAAAAKQKDPERVKLEEEKSAFQKQQEDAAITSTMNSSVQHAADKIDGGLKADVARLKLGPKATEKLRQEVFNEIVRRRQADKVWSASLERKFDGRKPKPEALKMLNDFTDANLDDAITEVVTTFYGPRKVVPKTEKVDPTAPKKAGAAAGATTQKAVAAGAVRVTAAPDRKDIDYNDPRTDVLNGKAVRKSDKKLVQWR